jgi:hypothetical protein
MNSCFTALKNVWAQMSQSARIGMVGALTLGIFLRALRFDIFEFKGDELEGIMRGLAAPGQHWWIEHGSTASVQIPFGPAFPYIMGLLTSVSPDPYVLTSFILAANIVVLMLAVLFFAEFSRDRNQFLLCVFLFSLSPYLIIFSRKIWQPNILLLFVIPLVLMITRVHRHPSLFLPIGLLSSIVVQLHHSGIFYMPVLICFAVLSFRFGVEPLAAVGRQLGQSGPDNLTSGFEKRKGLAAGVPETSTAVGDPPPAAMNSPRQSLPPGTHLWAAVGFAAFLLPLTPYMVFLLHHFRQTGITQWVAKAPYHLCLQGAIKWVLYSATGSHFWRYMFSGKTGDWAWPVPPLPGAILIICYILVVPFLFGVINYVKIAIAFIRSKSSGPAQRPDSRDLLCPLSIVFLFVIYCFILDHGRPHHYAIILPFLILALSEGILSLLSSSLSLRFGLAIRVLLCAGLISYALQFPFVLSYVNANNGSIGEYGICYREQRDAAKKIAALAGRGQIRINPAVDPDNLFPSSRKAELQRTIAYICQTEFGTNVLFNANPEPGSEVLKILKTGERLRLEVGTE